MDPDIVRDDPTPIPDEPGTITGSGAAIVVAAAYDRLMRTACRPPCPIAPAAAVEEAMVPGRPALGPVPWEVVANLVAMSRRIANLEMSVLVLTAERDALRMEVEAKAPAPRTPTTNPFQRHWTREGALFG